MSKSISVFANPTIDIIIKEGKKSNKIGGPPSYTESVLKNSGINYSIVSKVGKDFPLSEVSYKPIITKKPSTKFILEYFDGGRILYSPEACEPIKPEDCKACDIALVSGVFCEVLPETLKEIRKKSKITVADVQGFIRKKDRENKIYQVKLEDTDYKDIVKSIDYLKVSEDEIAFVDVENLRKSLTIIVTRGKEGCRIIDRDGSFEVKTKPIEEIDATGAGDCFLAGVGIGLAKGFDIKEACRIGNYFGGLAVRFLGVPKITKEDFKAAKL